MQASVENELKLVSQKLQNMETHIKEKQLELKELSERTPPPEFTEKIIEIRTVVDEVFPLVSLDFRYNDINKMQEVEDCLKVS